MIRCACLPKPSPSDPPVHSAGTVRAGLGSLRKRSRSSGLRRSAVAGSQTRTDGWSVQPLALFGGHAGRDEFLQLTGLVQRHETAVAGAGQRASAFHDVAQDGIEIKALADAQAGAAEPAEAGAQHSDVPVAAPQFPSTSLPDSSGGYGVPTLPSRHATAGRLARIRGLPGPRVYQLRVSRGHNNATKRTR